VKGITKYFDEQRHLRLALTPTLSRKERGPERRKTGAASLSYRGSGLV